MNSTASAGSESRVSRRISTIAGMVSGDRDSADARPEERIPKKPFCREKFVPVMHGRSRLAARERFFAMYPSSSSFRSG